MKDLNKASRIALPAAVFFASFSSIFIRWSDAPSLIIAFYRMLFSFLLLLPYFGYRAVSASSNRLKAEEGRQLPSLSSHDIGLALLSGFFLALHFASWITSLQFTSVASSVLLVNTHPVMVYLVGRFILKESSKKNELLFVLVTVAGSAILSWGDVGRGSNVLLGDSLAVIGAFSVGAYMVIGRILRKRMGVLHYTLFVYGSSMLVLLIIAVAVGLPLWPYSPQNLALFFALAFFCTILGHSIYSWALKYVSSTYLSVNVLLEPVLAGIMAYFFFQEVPSLLNIFGAFIVLIGIYGYSRASRDLTADS